MSLSSERLQRGSLWHAISVGSDQPRLTEIGAKLFRQLASGFRAQHSPLD